MVSDVYRTHLGVRFSRWRCFVGIFRPLTANYWISMSGSEGAQRAVMTLDPHKLAEDTEQIQLEREATRRSIISASNLVVMEKK